MASTLWATHQNRPRIWVVFATRDLSARSYVAQARAMPKSTDAA